MAGRRAKILGIAVILVAFLLASINSMAVTSLSITDTDPSTYIIVVMLMLFFLIVFSAKEELRFEYSRKNIAYGTALFVAFVLVLSYSRVALSFVFQSYRVDALLFSVFLASLIVLVFGTDGFLDMKHVPVYALFASPLLLLPLLGLSGGFANVNAEFVYAILRAIGAPVVKSGLTIFAPSLASVTISTTCVSLGTFAALAMFLIPVAYLYKGRLKTKALWVASGFALLLALNVARMFAISLVWAYYGIGSAIGVFHAFAGQLLFYASIIAMVLLAGRYGMRIERIRKVRERKRESVDMRLAIPAALAMVFGLITFVLSMQYLGAVYAPAYFFVSNTVNTPITAQLTINNMVASLAGANASVANLGATPVGELFALAQNRSDTGNATYVVASPIYGATAGGMVVNYTNVSGTSSYMLRNGITVTGAFVASQGRSFYVDYFALPYNYTGAFATINYEFFKGTAGQITPICSADSIAALGLSNYIESKIYNALRLQFGSGDRALMCYAYKVAASKR